MTTATRAGLPVPAILLVLIVAAVALISLVHGWLAPAIADNERRAREAIFDGMLPGQTPAHDYDSRRVVIEPDYLGGDGHATLYRLRSGEQTLPGVIIHPVRTTGYRGAIELAVAIDEEGVITAVRITKEQETPGLGAEVHQDRSDWLRLFNGHSLDDPPAAAWQPTADGGYFDQLSGATITSRSVISAVRKTLDFHALAGEDLRPQ